MLGTDLHSDLADIGELLCLSDKQGEGDSFQLLSLDISKYKHSALSLAGPRPRAWEVCKQVCNGERQRTAPVMLTTTTQAHRPLPPDDMRPLLVLCRALDSGLGAFQSQPGILIQSWLGQEANPLSMSSLHFHFSKELLIILHHLIFFASFIIYLRLSHMLHINILKILHWESF